MCGQDLSPGKLCFMVSRWEPSHGSGDSKMPACGGSKFGASHILTALILPREFIPFFFNEKSTVSCHALGRYVTGNYVSIDS